MGKRRRQKSQAGGVSKATPDTPSYSRRERLFWVLAVLITYAAIGTWGQFEFGDFMGYYNMLADGFLDGHLYVRWTPHQLALQDMVPFEGHYYLQWGPFPALVHLLPRLAGLRLSDRVACMLAGAFATLVFFEIIALLWQCYFPTLPRWLCRWFVLAFALGTPTFALAIDGSVYHESISIATLFVLLAFLAFLRYQEGLSVGFILLCGGSLGLAVATRVSYPLYAISLFAGITIFMRSRVMPWKQTMKHLAVFSVPIVISGVFMMAYNQARFRSPWEFGLTYSVGPEHRVYALNRMVENFRHYILAPARLSREAPWVRHVGWLPLMHTSRADDVSSIFIASPFLLVGALAWRHFWGRPPAPTPLRIFTATAAASGALMFFSLLCLDAASGRYTQDFIPAFMIVAFTGLGAVRSGVRWSRWRPAAFLVLFASAFLHIHMTFFRLSDPNAMKTFVALSPLIRRISPGQHLDELEAVTRNDLGVMSLSQGRFAEAIQHFEKATARMPHSDRIRKNLERARTAARQ